MILSQFTIDELTEKICERLKPEFQNFAPSQPKGDELITEKEAKEILKVSKVTLKSWRDKGLIKGYKYGSRIRYRKDELLNSFLTVKKYGRVEK